MFVFIIHTTLFMKINFIIQDLRDYHAVAKIITNIKPNIVVQLAAVAHANKSKKDPYSSFDHSFRTLENALDASKNNIDHFIYFLQKNKIKYILINEVGKKSDKVDTSCWFHKDFSNKFISINYFACVVSFITHY